MPMTRLVRSLVLALTLFFAFGGASSWADQKTVHVKGYTKKDGTYVKPHDRKAPGSDDSTSSSSSPKKEKKEKRDHSSSATPSVTHATSSNHNRCESCDRDSKGRIVRSKDAKKAFMKGTGFPHGRSGYVIDHINPLACGGADLPSNMQWQTVAEAKAKDRVERASCR